MEFRGLVQADKVYSVSEITEMVKSALEVAFPLVWVEGEISNYKKHTSGHVYFTLKDERSALKAVLFKSDARRVPFELTDGQKVVCRGRISVYEARGDYQLYVDLIEPKGKGSLQLAFEQLKQKLQAEGLFDPARKRKLPLRPKKIGLVTSPTGAAIRDILTILKRRYARLHILIYPAKVQGEGAAQEIASGLDYLSERPDIDVIIVSRGGGSIEDLWAFNEETVARAIHRSVKPVISAVGHEVDFTIADFVADVRAPTPSAAAEMVVEKEESFVERIEVLERRLAELLRYNLQEKRATVMELAGHRIFYNFKIKLMNLIQKIDELENRARSKIDSDRRRFIQVKAAVELCAEKLFNLISREISEKIARYENLYTALNSLSPLSIMKKGYAVCWKNGGLKLVSGAGEIFDGDSVIVSFYRGEFEARVTSVDRGKKVESRFLKEPR